MAAKEAEEYLSARLVSQGDSDSQVQLNAAWVAQVREEEAQAADKEGATAAAA